MQYWDGRKFDGNSYREKAARLALCEIGLAWRESEELPYDFTLIAERLREVHPPLGAAEVTPAVMLGLYEDETDYPV